MKNNVASVGVKVSQEKGERDELKRQIEARCARKLSMPPEVFRELGFIRGACFN